MDPAAFQQLMAAFQDLQTQRSITGQLTQAMCLTSGLVRAIGTAQAALPSIQDNNTRQLWTVALMFMQASLPAR